MKLTVNPVTGLLELVAKGGGGGGGDGIKKINGKGPDSSGNYVIKANDIPTASESSQGAALLASSDETIKGEIGNKIVTPKTLADKLGEQTAGKFYQGQGVDKPGKWVDIPEPPIRSLPFKKFNSFTKAQANYVYALVSPDPNPPVPLELPDRGNFREGDVIEVENVSGVSFKITIPSNSAVEIRYDDQLITDISGRYLLSEGAGSSIKLRAESNQLWYVVRRDRVTVSSGN
jgi:hypothetical protein